MIFRKQLFEPSYFESFMDMISSDSTGLGSKSRYLARPHGKSDMVTLSD
jgi:hypothetical protein